MSLLSQYRFVLHPQDADGHYLVTVPAFPGLSAFGSTREEALVEAEVALEGFAESYEAHGDALPTPDAVVEAPSGRFAPANFSGKFVVRLPRSVHARLAQLAEAEGVSLNQLVLARLAAA